MMSRGRLGRTVIIVRLAGHGPHKYSAYREDGDAQEGNYEHTGVLGAIVLSRQNVSPSSCNTE